MASWEQHIHLYITKLNQFKQLEEGVKYALIQQLELHQLNKDILMFNTTLKKMNDLFENNLKVNCADLVSTEELKQLLKSADQMEYLKNVLEEFCELDEFKDINEKAKLNAKSNQKVTKMLKVLNGIEIELNTVQRRIVQEIIRKLREIASSS